MDESETIGILRHRVCNFVDDRHALYVGWVCGIALRNGLTVMSVKDEHANYTDRVCVVLASGVSVVMIVPYPPDDWSLT